MTNVEFDQLVQRIEAESGTDTRGLYRRVFALTLLIYSTLVLPIALALIVGGGLIIPGLMWLPDSLIFLVMGGVILVFGGWAAGRQLWVRIRAPEGRRLTRTEAPVLFAALDELGLQLRATRVDQVLVVPEFNAGVVYYRRFGFLGGSHNYLMLGLPLMECLSRQEFLAVLAHEYAHLSRRHHRSSQWVYRLRRSWEQVTSQLSQFRSTDGFSARPLGKLFLRRWWPRFNACAFVLSRQHEYEADATSARLAGPEAAASALVRIAWLDRVLEETFWPEVWRSAGSLPTPPEGIFLRLARTLNSTNPETGAQALETAFRATNTYRDTHPCLSLRLRALGGEQLCRSAREKVASRTSASAAEALLGAALPRIREDVESDWRRRIMPRWLQEHQRANFLQAQLDQLQVAAEARQQDIDVLWEKARVFLEIHQPECAAPLLREILLLRPDHISANYNLGTFLLSKGDPAGQQYLECAVTGDEALLPQAANALLAFYQATGQTDRIRELYSRVDRYQEAARLARDEQITVTPRDSVVPHDLTPAELAEIRAILAGELDVVAAYLGRKELRYSKQAFYLLLVRLRPAWHRLPMPERDGAVVNRLSRTLPLRGRVLVFTRNGGYRWIASKLCRLPDAEVFPAQPSMIPTGPMNLQSQVLPR